MNLFAAVESSITINASAPIQLQRLIVLMADFVKCSFRDMEQIDGIQGSDFTSFLLPGASIPVRLTLCFSLTTFSSFLISPSHFCEEAIYFNNALSTSSAKSSRSASYSCVTTRFPYAPLTTFLCTSIWKIRESLRMKLMLCKLGASLFNHLVTMKVGGSGDRTCTILSSFPAKPDI